MTQPLNLLGVTRSPVAGKLRLYHAATVVPDITAELFDPDLLVSLAALASSRSRTWYDPMNEPGNWSMILQNDDLDLPLVAFKDLVNLTYKGETAATGIVEGMQRQQIDPAEEAGQFTTISGRLHGALFEKAVVYPTLGVGPTVIPAEQDRHINWSTLTYDDTGWINATVVTDVFTSQVSWPVPWPDATFPDGNAKILWASDGTLTTAGVGKCWFRQHVNAAAAGWYHGYLATDNIGVLYIDGQQVAATFFPPVAEFDILLAAGDHVIAGQCENLPGGAGNPAGIIWGVYFTDDQGGALGTLLGRSDASALIVEYSNDPPGVTEGFALLKLVGEFQARGILTSLTTTFTAGADSYGAPWPTVGDISTRVGNDMLAYLGERAAAGQLDAWMTPGMLELNGVVGGTRGT